MDMIKFKHKLRSRKNMINGERIKYLRGKNGFTQKDIATILGVESAAINKLCCGVEKTTFGETITNTNISMLEIDNIFNDFVKSNDPKPQIMMKIVKLLMLYIKKIKIPIIHNYIYLEQY